MRRQGIGRRMMVLAALAASGTPAFAADLHYATRFSAAPHTLATRANVMGKGDARATLAGRVLTVSGDYSGLPSAATGAHLKRGLAMGTPGQAFADLAVTGGVDGRLSGTTTLSAAQVTGLKAGSVSIVIDSVKAPDGNLWGWLAPAPAKP